jgi:hypothetical protein
MEMAAFKLKAAIFFEFLQIGELSGFFPACDHERNGSEYNQSDGLRFRHDFNDAKESLICNTSASGVVQIVPSAGLSKILKASHGRVIFTAASVVWLPGIPIGICYWFTISPDKI